MIAPIPLISFTITSVDPLGQGVFHDREGIVFIPRTLPGEAGQAQIWRLKQQVRFAHVESFTTTSPQRMPPQCPHYAECGGCHFQHTSYEYELQLKEETLIRLLRAIYTREIALIPATHRYFYRNRIQLHYHCTPSPKLGMIGIHPNRPIIEVPECQIINSQLQQTLRQLYQADSPSYWRQRLPPHSPTTGHLEIYQHPQKGQGLTWNAPYSDGGFSQVNDLMNEKLRALVSELTDKHQGPIVDLFGGNGNLTAQLTTGPVLIVDSGPVPQQIASHQSFFSLNLYKKNASTQLFQYLKRWSTPNSRALLILDPPRSGLKNLAQFTDLLRPIGILYVSCNPMTMARDLASIHPKYHVKQVYLLDLFPASYHFETVAYLEVK